MAPEILHKAEVQLIAQDAADKALAKHASHLPDLMKPTMYEVAETVARRGKEDLDKLFAHIFGADVKDQNHMRDLHKDLFYLRDQRIAFEARRTVMRQELVRSMFKWAGTTVTAAAAALAMILSYNPNSHGNSNDEQPQAIRPAPTDTKPRAGFPR